MTFETYYPAPYGVYNEMRDKKMAIGDTYYNGSQFCWSGSCSNPINATTNLVVEGDVSIGTANPIASSARQLYIYGSNSSGGGAYITLDSTTGYGAAPVIDFIRGGDYANRWEMGNDLAAAGGADNNFFIYTGRGGGRVLSLTPSGNVGIGTVNPGVKLEVDGSGRFKQGVFRSESGIANVWLGYNDTAGDYGVYQWQAAGTSPVNYFQNNVGIGITNPGVILHLRRDTPYGVHIKMENTIAGGRTWNILSSGSGNSGGSGNFHIYYENAGATSLFIQGGTGNVGIGTVSPTSKLYVQGDFTATGGKNFEIEHPTRPGYKLVHSTLEGPEIAVFYRGEDKLKDGQAVVQLPVYFEALTRKEGRTVLLTNLDGGDVVWVETQDGMPVKDGKFIVAAANPNSEQRFSWEVKAVRADIEPLKPEVVR